MKISVLTLARKRSRFLSHFLFNFLNKTSNHENTELLIMASANDDWNHDLFEYFKKYPNIHFFFEDSKYGKKGRHLFFNELVKHSKGDWILHTCDDQTFITQNWDNIIRNFIVSNKIDSNKPNIVIPTFDNTGSVDHFVSRGYLNILNRLGDHCNIDSWINDLGDRLPRSMIHNCYIPIMHDHTTEPEIFQPEYLLCDTSEGDKLNVPEWNSDIYKQNIIENANILIKGK